MVARTNGLRHGLVVLRLSPPRLVFVLAPFALFLGGCGHPASQEECETIFNQSAKMELASQRITDPKVVAERLEAARAATGEQLVNACLGKRITDDDMRCVREATDENTLAKCLE